MLEIHVALSEYALELEAQQLASPRAIANELGKIRGAAERVWKLIGKADPWTRMHLFVGSLREFSDGLNRMISGLKVRQPKTGQLPNMALRNLASRLALVFTRWAPKNNKDWRTFISMVLTAAEIAHPSPTAARYKKRFDALISKSALDELSGRLRPLPHRPPGTRQDRGHRSKGT
jgi:hypothetical protein